MCKTHVLSVPSAKAPFQKTTIERRALRPNDVLIDIKYSGICHSDIHSAFNEWCMRSAGLPIESLIEYVRLFQQGDETVGARKGLLVEQRDQLRLRFEEMNNTLDRMNHKIETYEKSFREKERMLAMPEA